MGPDLPRGGATLFRGAHRELNKASTDALHGVRPYMRDRSRVVPFCEERTRRLDPGSPAWRLVLAMRQAVPAVGRHVRGDEVPPRERPDLGRAVETGAYARICVEYDPRIPDAAVARVLGELAASGEALLREIVAMGKDSENARRAA